MLNTIYNEDCLIGMKKLQDQSVDMCLTDPPYFLDSLDDGWNPEEIEQRTISTTGTIKSLPKGMKFDPEQGIKFQAFFEPICVEIHRVLKPGGYFLSFSAPRLYHRMTMAIELAGFEIRDMLGWTYEGQAKAFSQDHIIRKNKQLSDNEKEALIKQLDGWKTPQLKPCIEPICLAQKATSGTYIQNWMSYGVGLMNTNARIIENKFPGNIIPVSKPTKKEKGDFNDHPSVKPLKLCEHLIELFTQENAIILDPFMGSGTTAVSAKQINRQYIGYELNSKYITIINKRLSEVQDSGIIRFV